MISDELIVWVSMVLFDTRTLFPFTGKIFLTDEDNALADLGKMREGCLCRISESK